MPPDGVFTMKTTRNSTEARELARRSGYMTDNLARATAQPAYRPDQQTRPERKRRTATQSAPVIGIRKSMGFFACAVMLASLCVILYNAVLFANVRAKTNELDREISALNNEYANLYRTNDEAEQAIASSVDINRVYEVAVGQYGMVYPKDNEIIVFDNKRWMKYKPRTHPDGRCKVSILHISCIAIINPRIKNMCFLSFHIKTALSYRTAQNAIRVFKCFSRLF